MKTTKQRVLTVSLILFALAFTSCSAIINLSNEGTSPSSSHLVPGGATVNLVEVADLDQTEAIEIFEFDLENLSPDEDYLPVFTIQDAQLITEIVSTLDVKIHESLMVECIPEHLIRFLLKDGTSQEISFSCHSVNFLRGKQTFFQGKDFYPPVEFTTLIEAQLEAHKPPLRRIVNIVEQANLVDVVKVEIVEQKIVEISEGNDQPSIVNASIHPLFDIEDPGDIAEILNTLDTELELGPRVRCPVNYFITFTMEDGRAETFGFDCGDQYQVTLRGDQKYFGGQDASLPEEFLQLLETLHQSR